MLAELVEAFNASELRDFRGEWVRGASHALRLPTPAVQTATHSVPGAAAQLRKGGRATVAERDLPALAAELAKDGAAHLHKLRVPGQSNLFDRPARQIPRERMPQIPTDAATMGKFMEFLRSKGMTARLEQHDPRALQATQNQLEGSKVGKAAAKLASPAAREHSRAILVSQHLEVADGHHHWAATAVHASTHRGYKVNALRINAPIDRLLSAMHEFDRREGIAAQAFGSSRAVA